MRITITDDLGKHIALEGSGDLTPEQLNEIVMKFTPAMSWKEIKKEVNNFDISREAKKLLLKLGQYLMRVGSAMLGLGQKLLELIILTVKRHSNVAESIVIAAILWVVAHGIPIIGPLLATPAAAIVIMLGIWWDLKRRPTLDPDLDEEIHAKIKEVFDALKKWLNSLKPEAPPGSGAAAGSRMLPA